MCPTPCFCFPNDASNFGNVSSCSLLNYELLDELTVGRVVTECGSRLCEVFPSMN